MIITGMNKLQNTSQYFDLQGLDQLRVKSKNQDKASLREVAQQFESIFVQMLMKSMRAANVAFETDSPMNNQYVKFYQQMQDQQMSVELGANGALGLADLMVQQLSGSSDNFTAAALLRNNSQFSATKLVETNSLNRDSLNTHLVKTLSVNSAQSSKPADASIDRMNNHKPFNESVLLTPKSRASLGYFQQNSSESNPIQAFIKQLQPLAKNAAEKLGVNANVLLAQSALETGWGQKVIKDALGQSSFNLFNIKADKRWTGERIHILTTEYENGVPQEKQDYFRAYSSFKESFDDFVDYIKVNPRYQKARDLVSADPSQFIQALKNAGYATDPKYVDKVMSVMQRITQFSLSGKGQP